MLVKKLIVSAMGTGLLWAAGLAGHAAVAGHPGLLLLAGQVRLSLGDREGGLRLMRSAVQQDQTSQSDPAAAAADSTPVSSTPAQTVSAKCAANTKVSQVASRGSHSARVVVVGDQVLPADFARLVERRERRVVQLSLEQAHLSRQMRVMVLQQMRDLPPSPAVPAEPMHANP